MADPWVKFYSSDWLAGTGAMTAAERGVYITLIAMMYEADGPVSLDRTRLSRRCGLPAGSFKRALDALIDLGKIIETPDGLINPRAEKEIEDRQNRITTLQSGARKSNAIQAKKRQQKQQNTERPASAQRSANQNQSQNTDTNVSDVVTSLWGEGLKILVRLGVKERQARSVIGKWRKSHGDGETLKALLQASKAEASDPIPYVEKVLRGDSRNRPVSDEEHAAAWGMRNANHDGDSGRTANNRRQEPSRRPEDDLPGMQSQPQTPEPEAALSQRDVQGGWDCGALPSLRLVGGEAF